MEWSRLEVGIALIGNPLYACYGICTKIIDRGDYFDNTFVESLYGPSHSAYENRSHC